MLAALLIASSLAGAAPVQAATAEIDHAITMGRLDEARMLIDAEGKAGGAGPALDRSIADLAFAAGRDADALARYVRLLNWAPNDLGLLERASVAAMRAGDFARAGGFIESGVRQPGASWRLWNAKGVLADRAGDWAAADRAYARAAELAPGRAEVPNNAGWSELLRGEWDRAVPLLQYAAALDPSSQRIADNLEFARMGVAEGLPERGAAESLSAWAARLNDAGVAARMRGNRAKALAAFSRALEVSERWDAHASANIKQLAVAP